MSRDNKDWTEEMVKKLKPAVELWVDGRVIPGRIVGKPGKWAYVTYDLNGEQETRPFTWDAIVRHLNDDEALYA